MDGLIHILEKEAIPVSWGSIFIGYQLKIIDKKEVSEYAEMYLGRHDNCDYLISELVFDDSDCEDILRKIIKKRLSKVPEKNNDLWDFEKRKWRFGLLVQVKNEKLEVDDLLHRIATIYVRFDYPSDMENFIYYLPPTDGYNPGAHTQDENYKRLLGLFNSFLEKELINFKKLII